MRTLARSAVLSSFVFGGCLSAASAQTLGADAFDTLSPAQDGRAAGAEDVPVGVIPQPSAASPGMVTGVTLGELYTDNLTLAAEGTPRETSWITQVEPFFKGARSGPRFFGVLDYKMTGYLYAGRSRSNQLAQDLQTRGTFAVIPRHLYIDGAASYDRQVIDNELSSGSGTFFLDNNQANVATTSVSPYWVQDFGKGGKMLLRYTWGRVLYDQHGISGGNGNRVNGLPDGTSNGLQFSLASPDYQTWGWNVEYSDQRINSDSGQNVEYSVAKLGTSWQIGNGIKLLADGGKETQFLPDGTYRQLGASFYDAGFDWSNSRDNLKVLVGHRFYGPSYQLSWSREAALLTTSLSYIEQPTDLNQQLLGQNPSQNVAPSIGTAGLTSLTDRRVYLMKRATASATYAMPNGSLQVELYNERRSYFFRDESDQLVANGDIAWKLDIGPFTALTTTVGLQRYEFQSGQKNYNHYSQVSFVHQVNPRDFVNFRVRRESRDVYSEVPGAHGYQANVVFAQWTHLF